jgi:hypothetical protein
VGSHSRHARQRYSVVAPTCPSRKSYPRILMMQAGQNGRGDNGSASLDRLSFPKIISARSDDAIRTELVWQ